MCIRDSLDGGDVGMLRQLDIGGRFNANARAGRDIVEDHRLGAGIGNGVVHGHQAPLGGLDVYKRQPPPFGGFFIITLP